MNILRKIAVVIAIFLSPMVANGTVITISDFDSGMTGWETAGRAFGQDGQAIVRTIAILPGPDNPDGSVYPSAREVTELLGLPLVPHPYAVDYPLEFTALLTPFDLARTDGIEKCVDGGGDDCFTQGGAAMWRDFSSAGASSVAFDFKFSTIDDSGVGDAGFVFLISGTDYFVASLASSSDYDPFPFEEFLPYLHESFTAKSTGPDSFGFSFAGTGTFTLGFAVFHAGSPYAGSALFVDNIMVATVPEPGTLALLGIGLFGMGLSRRRRKV